MRSELATFLDVFPNARRVREHRRRHGLRRRARRPQRRRADRPPRSGAAPRSPRLRARRSVVARRRFRLGARLMSTFAADARVAGAVARRRRAQHGSQPAAAVSRRARAEHVRRPTRSSARLAAHGAGRPGAPLHRHARAARGAAAAARGPPGSILTRNSVSLREQLFQGCLSLTTIGFSFGLKLFSPTSTSCGRGAPPICR